ncbi:Orsellinic acid biosynthesis cluster [Hyphodiscus hymeniophilus]|uniref:Orsellinic acid biosynthesis cluster n=1 Tax=Hyphodiscus hymeniophilus TaxID=353542 RepID=A0A9P6VLL3_9HELO|nr:Orsellinic acid biosynthesis cluster [Hyphodiscus hymeniophilus]
MPLEPSAPSLLDPDPAELFRYLPSYKVVVCVTCQYAVQPHAIPRHLKDIHHIHRGRRRPFMQYISKLELGDPEDVIESKIYEFPVPIIPVQDGLACQSGGCAHLCVSEKRMKSHWLSVHGRQGRSILDWQPAPLQTFFRGNLLRYFTERGVVREAIPTSQTDTRIITLTNVSHQATTLSSSDRALLQHYVTSTSISIAHDESSEALWQVTVPQLASQHPFLMHGILACSALHVAYKYPAQQGQHLIEASRHQSIAMPLFRSAIGNVNEDNCHSVMVFSHLLVIYSFALERQDERLLIVEGDGPDVSPSWLHFLRNGCVMICFFWDQIKSGPVRDLANQWDVPIVTENCDLPLVDYFLSAIPPCDSQYAWSEEECRLYTDAAVELGEAFAYAQTLGEKLTTWDALRIWPLLISVEFMDVLHGWHPGALILLAHYCVLLKTVECHWYFEGRATKLLSTILKRIDARWLCFIRGPLKDVGTCASDVLGETN